VLEPALRGQGLGGRLIAELLAEARTQAMQRLELVTFSALTTAARIYRGAGFEVIASRDRDDWGPTITFQHYALEL
jgi:GNAT superfamily N-acetyltransferase